MRRADGRSPLLSQPNNIKSLPWLAWIGAAFSLGPQVRWFRWRPCPSCVNARRKIKQYSQPANPVGSTYVARLSSKTRAGNTFEIVLTSDTCVGTRGYEHGADSTEYEIYLYDAAGTPVGPDNVAKRLVVPAMQTTVIKTADLVGPGKAFWGGLKVRLRPHGREPMHASDLFSSAFVRWLTANSFDNVRQRIHWSGKRLKASSTRCPFRLWQSTKASLVSLILMQNRARESSRSTINSVPASTKYPTI